MDITKYRSSRILQTVLITIFGLLLLTQILNRCSPTTPVIGVLSMSCTVGVVGTDASITVQGLLAGQECKELLTDPASLNLDYPFYRKTQAIAPSVVCEYDISGRRFIVRDEGALKIVGASVCLDLQQRQ